MTSPTRNGGAPEGATADSGNVVQDIRSLFTEYTPWSDANALLDALRAGDALATDGAHVCEGPVLCWYLSKADYAVSKVTGHKAWTMVYLCRECRRDALRSGAFVYVLNEQVGA